MSEPYSASFGATPAKSAGIAFLLTFFFGPIGMLYSTVTGAIVMFLANLAALLLTAGLGLFVTWPIGIVWAVVAAQRSARRF